MGEVKKHISTDNLITSDNAVNVSKELNFCAGYFGLAVTPVTTTLFIELCQTKLRHISLSDVGEAFKAMFAGQLDTWLHKDSKGQPDKAHFGQFSVDFIMRVVNAYLRLKESSNPKKQLEYKKTYTLEQIAKIHADHVADLIQWADIDRMSKPLGGLGEGSEFIYGQFAAWGLVPNEIEKEPVAQNIVQAKPRINRLEKDEDLLGRGTKEHVIRAIMVRRAIEKLHKEGKTLKSIIETHEK